jgi:hypothetical protein
MTLHHINDLAELHRHLHSAMQLEHATIPPYLTALYSIHPGTNSDAYHIIRAVVVEEMLHLTLAANLLNAVGGNPDLTQEGFVPRYPAYLPDGETDFQVNLQRFSRETIETFLKIERPAIADSEAPRTTHRRRNPGSVRASRVHDDSEEHFYSIGEFYQAVEQAIERFHGEQGDALFSGDPKRQVTPDYYYSGGGEIIPVTNLATAKAAIRLISEQGEGLGGGIFDYEGEISHFYRFQQLVLGRYYQEGDEHGRPSGPALHVDWDAVYPLATNASISDYPDGSELRAAAVAFNAYYGDFLRLLNRAFRGEPGLLIEAVGGMFRIKEMCYELMRQPLDASGANAAPTFEISVPGEGMK